MACPSGGCETVLSSRYATLFNTIPLSMVGFLTYVLIGVLALVPLMVSPDEKRSLRTSLEDSSWLALFAIATSVLLFSGYLMYIMTTEFVLKLGLKGLCYFCLASALSATAIFVVTLMGRDWDDRGQLTFIGVIVGMITLVGTLAIYTPQKDYAGAGTIADAQGNVFYLIDNTSGDAEIQLAKHLTATGAKMYGAYWCPHCCEQKQLFGKEAIKDLTYVECAEGGANAQPEVCKQALEDASKQTGEPPGFPTWFVNGKYYSGRQLLPDLAKNSGYTGSQNFKNEFRVCRQP